MRIDSERDRKEGGVAGLRRIAVEEIAVVEIAVRARIGDRLRRLVNGKIVALAQRQRKTPPDGACAMLVLAKTSTGRSEVKARAQQRIGVCAQGMAQCGKASCNGEENGRRETGQGRRGRHP